MSGSPSLAGRTILVAESNAVSREVACGLLAETGAFVLTADDGLKVVGMFSPDVDHPPPVDIVLMAARMPGLDGYEIARLLRLRPGCRNLPILAMLARAEPEEQKRCRMAGMDDYIKKPIHPHRLYGMLRTHLPAGGSPRRTGKPAVDLPVLPGVDVPGAVERLAHNVPLYVRLLRRFHAGQGKVRNELQKALNSGALDEALRLAHILGGMAGTLGATELLTQALSLEMALRGELAEVPLLGNACLASLDRFADLLEQTLPVDALVAPA